MRWSPQLVTVVVVGAWLGLLGQGVRGQIPLPTAPQETVNVNIGAHGGVPHSGSAVGVPLPPLGHGQAGASGPSASGGSGSHAPVGIPLPTITNPELVHTGVNHPIVVPLDHAAGGAPLPPYHPVGGNGVGGGLFGGQGATGGLRAVNDPTKDEAVRRVSGLASVRERMQKETRADNAVKITNVITAHKQVVAGQLVYLSMKVSETKCPIGTPDLSACVLDPTEDEHVCEIVVWERPWLNSSKIIDEKTRCIDAEDDVDFDAWGPVNRLGSALGASEINIPNLPDHIDEKQMSIEAFNYVDFASDSKFRGELVSYDIENIMFDPVMNSTKVRVKVEYGFTYCIKWVGRTEQRLCPHNTDHDHYVCSVTVVDNPNEITSLSVIRDRDDDIPCIRKREVQEELVIPVRAPCLGCPQAAPLSDPTILEIADFALTEYDRTSNDDDLHMVLKLIKAQTQVVAGIKYYLTLEIAETTCSKLVTGVDVNRTFCNQDHTEETKICDIVVIEQSWIPTRDLVDARCTDSDSYGASTIDEFIVPVGVGGVSLLGAAPQPGIQHFASPLFPEPSISGANNNRNIVDQEAQQLAQLIAQEYNHREDDDDEYYKVVKVHEATATATGGRRLVVELGETFCNKRQILTADAGVACQLDPTEETEVCTAEIADPSNTHLITSFHCQDMDDYLVTKMSPSLSSFHIMDHPFLNFPNTGSQGLTGGMTAQNTNTREIKDLAAYVAQQYNLRSDEDELFIMTNIISAHSQVVNGRKYLLEVEVSESHCKKYQLIADPSRCPLAFDEEPEVCQAEIMISTNQQRELTRLYCDDRDDYYTNKILRNQHPSGVAIGGTSGFTGGLTGGWSAVNVNDTKLQHLALMVADEFDLRSDEDNIFVVHHLVEAKQQVVSGMNYHLVIELAETVCPKYKTSINKARCHVDIGEEHMVCEAKIWEQSWLNKLEVTDLRCAEKDEFTQGHESVEILFPEVHPTSHARPVFLNKFFRDNSAESEESNERFYSAGSGRHSIRRHDSDEDDSDELPSFSRHRGKRSSIRADPLDSKVQKLAEFSINTLDALGDDPRRRVLTEVISAKKKVVSGLQWSLRVLVTWTSCMKDDPTVPSSECIADANEPQYICDLTVFEKPWVSVKPTPGSHFRKVTEANCKPISTPTQ
ncbi:unnamed protein product [Meganyctiphanes norvegica]|uniref:Cystatin domain-containing protein n=1 Tax=Meganyctiphanes norvegica TaxID=48144 RepID=A0AAV2Q8B6_MEGNR